MKQILIRGILACAGVIVFAPAASAAQLPQSVRLYVLDCGTLHLSDVTRFDLKREEVTTLDVAVPCYLVAHPQGTLLWEAGAQPDSAWKPAGGPVSQRIVLADGQQRNMTLRKSLTGQLAAIGYAPVDVTYLALSHYHYDHTANANEFAGATWIVQKVERDAMFAEKPPGTTQPSTYSALRESKTKILNHEDADVFGDGTVVIKPAPGHTPGHQVLCLKLAKTGNVVLSGDLYHYAEERALQRVPTFEYDADGTRASRSAMEAFLKETGARLWIQHDLRENAKLKKSPEFYE